MNIHGTSNTGSNSDTVVILTRNTPNMDRLDWIIDWIGLDWQP